MGDLFRLFLHKSGSCLDLGTKVVVCSRQTLYTVESHLPIEQGVLFEVFYHVLANIKFTEGSTMC